MDRMFTFDAGRAVQRRRTAGGSATRHSAKRVKSKRPGRTAHPGARRGMEVGSRQKRRRRASSGSRWRGREQRWACPLERGLPHLIGGQGDPERRSFANRRGTVAESNEDVRARGWSVFDQSVGPQRERSQCGGGYSREPVERALVRRTPNAHGFILVFWRSLASTGFCSTPVGNRRVV
jgi:hypothetical protein